ncbi:MAG: valine--tRNA ligase [Candidatus Thioglobus sp.]|nr:valine--tRNA ligase [Candidatus Thioglobus sp.]
MEKTYNPSLIEPKYQKLWAQQRLFSSDANPKNPPNNAYCIMLPPPNITGSLHMGHAFQHTIMDILARYHRAKGEQTLWQPGTDHAGIATQMVVERQLAAEKTTRQSLGRDKFIDRIWDWKQKSGGRITTQMRRLGASVDWEKERFTLDEGLSAAVKKVFIQLYNEGLIYRGKRLVNWDPILQTALSDLEVTAEPENGFMYYIRYPFADENGFMEIATTRPETILADGALAVNPADKRYKNMVGKWVKVPLTTRKIPIVADDYVEAEFGTGCVKITPAHDFNDWEVGKRHKMEIINLFSVDAKMSENAPKAYQGLDRFVARKQIINDLEAAGLLIETKPHKLTPPRGDRSGAILEPYLTDQWFVKIAPLAAPAIAAVKNGDIKFVPKNWDKTYFNWMENINDWCISRQIWWGHRIPAWYDENGKIYVADSLKEAQNQAGKNAKLTQDNDVLDTWFSSALWPFSTLGWPEKTADLARFYPTNILVTGFDIIFFWVARMIMFGLKFTGAVPFTEIYITGLIRDNHGQKMSKSKGNVLDPIDLIDGISLENLLKKRTENMMQPKMQAKISKQTKAEFPHGIPAFGTDALRFTFAALASFGRDIKFDFKRVEGYRNFCNKLWNASRFVIMQFEGEKINSNSELSVADKWIISRLQNTKIKVAKHLADYRFDLMSKELYEFVWNDYCSWYLELSKPLLQNDFSKPSSQATLLKVLDEILILLHPIIPFITEEIFAQLQILSGSKSQSLSLEKYPEVQMNLISAAAEEEIQWLQTFTLGVRKIRSEMNISPAKLLPCFVQNIGPREQKYLQNHTKSLNSLAKLASIEQLENQQTAPESAIALVDEMKILIPLAGLIDKKQEIERLNKEIEKLEKQKNQFESKLNNAKFVNSAPAEVVEKEKQRLAASEKAISKLASQLSKISNL